ncbi:MAG: penicillin-binding protein 1C [Vicinamibacterales bacterium]
MTTRTTDGEAAVPGAVSRRRWRRAAAGAVVLAGGLAWLRMGPLPAGLLDPPAAPTTVVVDRNGEPLYEALSAEAARAIPLDAAALPPRLVAATLAAEDRRYYRHVGLDPVAIARAVRVNLAEGRAVEGGSTISQQVAKLLLNRRAPGRPRGWTGKLEEAVVALRLEHRFDKTALLAHYLNHAGYGRQYVGAERASQAYFGVSASMLTSAQAAFLAGLPQRPSAFDPFRRADAARARQRTVLRRMAAAGALDESGLAAALGERLVFAPVAAPFGAPHFVAMALAAAGSPRPARLETTLDSGLQADIAGIIARHRADLDAHGAHNVAVVVLDNATAEWRAWEGSGDYFDEAHGGRINGPVTLRQPGSALKPFTYALAFDAGRDPATVLADVPSSFPTADEGVVYSPRNYDGMYRGPLLARAALAGSINVPAVALAAELGVPDVLRFLRRAGLTTFDKTAAHYGLGVTLGNAEVRLDELTAAYAAFARGGEYVAPTFLTRQAAEGPGAERIMSDRAAFWITDILSDPEAREFVFGRGGSLELPFPVAAKTGTSQAYHDNWTIGYSRHATVGVWVGNFDRRPLRNSSGVTGAGPIFHAVMLAAERRLAGGAWSRDGDLLPAPPTVVEHEICADSGLRANAWCPRRRREWLPAERADTACNWHHPGDHGLVTVLPAAFDAWAGGQGRAVRQARADVSLATGEVPGRAVAAARVRPGGLTVTSPPDGATYLIDPTLRREFQTVPLRATGDGGRRLTWTVSGRAVAAAPGRRPPEWPLAPGTHRIEVRDDRGRRAAVTITVR